MLKINGTPAAQLSNEELDRLVKHGGKKKNMAVSGKVKNKAINEIARRARIKHAPIPAEPPPSDLCPTCGSSGGRPCVTRSGVEAKNPHVSRPVHPLHRVA